MRRPLPLQTCRSCSRHLPRAAHRCPWCKLPAIAWPGGRIPSMGGPELAQPPRAMRSLS